MAKTFEQDGETYIVSDGVESLDTENLVNKNIIQAIMQINGGIPIIETTQPEKENAEPQKITKEEKVKINFTLSGAAKTINVYAHLEEFVYADSSILLNVKLSPEDFIRIPFLFLKEKDIFCENITILYKNKVNDLEDDYRLKVRSVRCVKGENKNFDCEIQLET